MTSREPAVVRHPDAVEQRVEEPGSSAQSKIAAVFSRLRSAFCSASVKLRPIAIASPTDFMCVVSVGSAVGNFSNANRGTFTTT